MPMLAPSPKFRAVGTDGLALVGGKLYTYTAGTSTPKDSYTNFGAGTANTNPVILDARGEADVWLQGSYKLVLKDSLDQTIWTVDDIRDLTSDQTFTNATLAGTLSITGGTITWAANNTHSGNHTFSANVAFNGTTTIGNASSDALTINSDTVTWTNGATHSGDHTWSGTQTFNDDATFNDPVSFTDTVSLPTGALLPGTYTPTITNGTNVAASTAYLSTYLRVGNFVTVWFQIDVDPTSGATSTDLGISLPVASNLANARTDLTGTAVRAGGDLSATLTADSTNDRAFMLFTNDATTTNSSWAGQFSYRVI